MICPRCNKGRMILKRIEHRDGEVVYVYVCDNCGHRLEESFKRRKPSIAPDWEDIARRTTPQHWSEYAKKVVR